MIYTDHQLARQIFVFGPSAVAGALNIYEQPKRRF